jgi:hypothetical protein
MFLSLTFETQVLKENGSFSLHNSSTKVGTYVNFGTGEGFDK